MQYAGKRPDLKYLAIKHDGHSYHTWYEKEQPPETLSGTAPGIFEVVYVATGETVLREDGELAEIYVREQRIGTPIGATPLTAKQTPVHSKHRLALKIHL